MQIGGGGGGFFKTFALLVILGANLPRAPVYFFPEPG